MNRQQSERQHRLIATNSLHQSTLTWLFVQRHRVKRHSNKNMALYLVNTNQRSLLYTAAFRLFGTTGTNYVINQLD